MKVMCGGSGAMNVAVFLALVGVVCGRALDDEWHIWKLSHRKAYREAEDKARREAWLENSVRIKEHNRGNLSFSLAVNEFADMTPQEFSRFYLAPKSVEINEDTERVSLQSDEAIPDSLDCRDEGIVTNVLNQGKCGSSWAFSAIGALEGQFAKQTGQISELSVQQLMDCSCKYGTDGCNGGLPTAAFNYIKQNGVCLASCYSYLGYAWKCMSKFCTYVAGINKYVCLNGGSESELQQAVYKIGPISVSVDATSYEFQFYSGGIYSDSSCSCSSVDLNHSLLLIGYGTSDGQDFWIAKNSWGTSWGESGYIRIARNRNNMCGIATAPCYPYARLLS